MNFFTTEMRRDPYPTYRALRASTPVVHVPGADLYVVLDYDGVRRVLGDHEAFRSNVSPSRNLAFEWLLFMDPPKHERLRAIVSQAFTPRSIAALEPRVRAIAAELVDAVIDRGEVDLATEIATPLPMRVMAEMIGVPPERWRELARWSEAIMNLAETIAGAGPEAAAASAAFLAADAEMRAYFDALAADRAAAPRDDLLTRLVTAEVEGERLGDVERLRFIELLLAAGTETTTNLVDNAVLALVEHPEQLARLQADPTLVPGAIEEVVRYRSPAQFFFRAACRDVELGGIVVPAGKLILVGIGSANRDPAAFTDPERFDVARAPNPHLGFGRGIHFCLGAPLARLEGRVLLGELLARCDQLALASTEPWEPRRAFHVHGPTRLPITFRPRSSSTGPGYGS